MGKVNNNQKEEEKLRMHPRNVFINSSHFKMLLRKKKDFREFCKQQLDGTVVISSEDVSSIKALNLKLLEEFFGLEVKLAPCSVVPTVSLRLNYILWMEDLLNILEVPMPEQIRGIDVGCGSSGASSLLGAKKNKWKMIGLETNERNVQFVNENVEHNKLGDLVTIYSRQNRTNVLDCLFKSFLKEEMEKGESTPFQFTMGAAPILDSFWGNPLSRTLRNSDMTLRRTAGIFEELSYPGGEIAYFKKYLKLSAKNPNAVWIYSTLISHKDKFAVVMNCLKESTIADCISMEFNQGQGSTWGVAWTFLDSINLSQLC